MCNKKDNNSRLTVDIKVDDEIFTFYKLYCSIYETYCYYLPKEINKKSLELRGMLAKELEKDYPTENDIVDSNLFQKVTFKSDIEMKNN